MSVKEILINKAHYFVVFVVSYCAPIGEAMFAVGALILIDTITGIWGSLKAGGKFSSTRLGETITKLLIYNVLLISAHIIETTLVNYIPFIQITLSFLAITEFISIGENFTRITGLRFVQYLKEKIKNYYKNEELRNIVDNNKED